ncbi:MinD/ParA family ATP-binding protein [Antrihabitans stalactiti]|uniref:MinD-like ATPase involved in chromosome partitioning or flagellar assembly n=1 Tax=Antrihabitans stalactiti TaxID=2584121 RepID=A0A848KCW9_9NOCA|nr:hypothetical protein [Antrihabitans stalactiti]NMN95014.1 hypothetical protein [Antrihabitans stalactiti]
MTLLTSEDAVRDETKDDGAHDWLFAPAPAGSPTDIAKLGRERPKFLRVWTTAMTASGLLAPPPLLVLGGSGGAGVTATAQGLASVIATDEQLDVDSVVVDATPAGGSDLVARVADEERPMSTLQTWLTSDDPSLPSTVEAACGRASSGALVLPRDDRPLPRRETMVSVHRHLSDAGVVPVYDGGAPVSARGVRPLLADSRISLALVVAARPDAANRLKPVLSWLDDEFGEFLIGDTVIVVCRQSPRDNADVAGHLRRNLDGWVRSVVEIPYDPHLAIGERILWSEVRDETREAYRNVLRELTS